MSKLIIGLGNPGKEYVNTRHNVGFIVLDSYLGKIDWKEEKNLILATNVINGEKIFYLKPLTFMNLSGIAVKKIVDYYKIELKDILVIHDDLALDSLNVRFKFGSGAGGHNGVQNIIDNLKSNKFCQMKIGIGENKLIPTSDFVLGKLSKNEVNNLSTDYGKMIDDFINFGIEYCMNKYN